MALRAVKAGGGAVPGFFQQQMPAVVDEVGSHACRCLFGPQAVAIVGRAKGGAADGGQAVFGIKAERHRGGSIRAQFKFGG